MAGSGAFSIVPVIDLKGGRRRAREGRRARLLRADRDAARRDVPSRSPSSRASSAPGRRGASTSPISTRSQATGEHRADVAAHCEALRRPRTLGRCRLLRACDDLDAYGLPRNARPVIGSESQRDAAFLRARDGACILSLDSKGEERLDPAALDDDPSLWPRDGHRHDARPRRHRNGTGSRTAEGRAGAGAGSPRRSRPEACGTWRTSRRSRRSASPARSSPRRCTTAASAARNGKGRPEPPLRALSSEDKSDQSLKQTLRRFRRASLLRTVSCLGASAEAKGCFAVLRCALTSAAFGSPRTARSSACFVAS